MKRPSDAGGIKPHRTVEEIRAELYPHTTAMRKRRGDPQRSMTELLAREAELRAELAGVYRDRAEEERIAAASVDDPDVAEAHRRRAADNDRGAVDSDRAAAIDRALGPTLGAVVDGLSKDGE